MSEKPPRKKHRVRTYFVEDKDGKSIPVEASRVEITTSGVLCIYAPRNVYEEGGEELAWAFNEFDWVRCRQSSAEPLDPEEWPQNEKD
jgi:hypothetical protein